MTTSASEESAILPPDQSVTVEPDLLPDTPPVRAGDRRQWGHMLPGTDAWVLHQLVAQRQQAGSRGPVVVLGADTSALERLEREYHVFAPISAGGNWLPDWETLPYDTFSPHQDIVSDRLRLLAGLQQSGMQTTGPAIFVPLPALLHRVVPPEFVAQRVFRIATGDLLAMDALRDRLAMVGYISASTVTEHGEFSVRGGLVDLFPMGADEPVRIELFDNQVESIRIFDPETQRTRRTVDRFELLPAREFPLDQAGIGHFREAFRARFDVNPRQSTLYQDVSNGLAPAGIEYYLPLFFDRLNTLFDYLPTDSLLVVLGDLDAAATSLRTDIEQRYENRRHDLSRPVLSPNEIYLRLDEIYQGLARFPRIEFVADPVAGSGAANAGVARPAELPVDHRAQSPLKLIREFLARQAEDKQRVLFCAESQGRRESLLDLLNDHGIRPELHQSLHTFLAGDAPLGLTLAPLSAGIVLPTHGLILISEAQLFGEQTVRARQETPSTEFNSSELAIRNLAELKAGQPVVHLEHGVGRYQGLETLTVDNQDTEFLKLAYANDAKLYVPVTHLHLISRYAGGEDSQAPLHKLGTERWSNARRKAAEKIRDTAAELLDVYARREARTGFIYPAPGEDYRRFAAEFPFAETADQKNAINAVLQDMMRTQPMDRLVCGDVGFGKTEVALRAAFMAAHAGKQVAVLVPTTLLAQQHHDSFVDRFANWPVRVEVLSRFRTGKETDRVLADLDSGRVDILIATHKLLSKGVRFKDLGLLIVDEEHRFGVQQKERIKALRANVDILALTATPIPRTLNMAMSNIRDLSIIATPPARRLSVKTFVRERENALIKEAIYREILRGGQVFFLHNEVRDIERVADEVRAAVPEARVAIGHGQMRERDLEKVMSDVYHRRFNVLVCTTIIETGIDIPTANTIIIDRADKFGLAQLHQLRGRVGRSHHQAYAYLLTPPWKGLARDAQKRLEAISEAQDLGAGFMLATHDLEIRGAGELLGEDQSGHIESIGFSLYMEMLEDAVEALRAGREPDVNLHQATWSVDVNLGLPALIPVDYLPDINTRLTFYKRIASARDGDALKALRIEMIDRFGLLPAPLKNLFQVTELRHELETVGIDKLTANDKSGSMEFSARTRINPVTVVNLVQTQPETFQMRRSDRLNFSLASSADDRFERIREVLDLVEQGLQS